MIKVSITARVIADTEQEAELAKQKLREVGFHIEATDLLPKTFTATYVQTVEHV